MKKITATKVKKELHRLGCDESTTQLILNNVWLYNDLIEKYQDPLTIKKDAYLIYQLNSQIIKQIDNVKKKNERIGVEPNDSFTDLMESIKGLEKRKIG